MRICFMPLATIFILYYVAAGVQGQDTEKIARDTLSESTDEKNNIHFEKNYPNPF